MARYITCTVKRRSKRRKYENALVWTYTASPRKTGIHRIYDEMKLGRYSLRRWSTSGKRYEIVNDRRYATSDVLILSQDDISAIKQQLPILAIQEELAYLDMLEAICKFAERFPEQAEFTFEGDLD